MTRAAILRTLGDLAGLLEVAARLPGDPRTAVLTEIVTLDQLAAAPETPDFAGVVPVIVGGLDSLPWAIAVVAITVSLDVPELVPDFPDETGRNDHDAWSRTCEEARDLLRELAPWSDMPERVIDEIHDARLQAAIAYLRVTTTTDKLVLVDGPVAASAVLALESAAPGQTAHVWPIQQGETNLERVIWLHLERRPLLPWRTSLTNGELASLAMSAAVTSDSIQSGAAQTSTPQDRAVDPPEPSEP